MSFFNQFDTVANAEAGAKLHFTIPNSDELAYLDADAKEPKLAVTVTMLGSSSSQHKKHAVKSLRKMRADAKRKGNRKSDDISDTFFEDTASAQVERLLSVVTGWENINLDGKKSLEFTPANVEKVFTQYQELRVQAINFLDDDVNFIGG